MSQILRFGCYEADLAAGQLRKDGVKVNLRDQSFNVLVALLERAGEVVSREELRNRIWPERAYGDFDNGLNTAVARLREALCESAEQPRLIETLPKRGYRFIADVKKIADGRFKRAPGDLRAFNECVQGRLMMEKGTAHALANAKQRLENAVAAAPDFAEAYDALAELYWYLGYLGFMPPRRAFSAGIAYALRALEIDDSRGETHALLGQFHKISEYNWSEVEREMALALRLAPTSPVVRMRYAVSGLMPHGRLHEAAAELEYALQLDSMSVLPRMWLGIVLVLERRYEQAMEQSRKLLQEDESYYFCHFIAALCYHYRGMSEQAIAAQLRAVELSGGAAAMMGWLGLLSCAEGRISEARGLLQRLHGMATGAYVPPSSFAWIHLGLRELDPAFDWLNRAVEECDQFLMPVKSYRFLDPLRNDPRFIALLQHMNLDRQPA